MNYIHNGIYARHFYALAHNEWCHSMHTVGESASVLCIILLVNQAPACLLVIPYCSHSFVFTLIKLNMKVCMRVYDAHIIYVYIEDVYVCVCVCLNNDVIRFVHIYWCWSVEFHYIVAVLIGFKKNVYKPHTRACVCVSLRYHTLWHIKHSIKTQPTSIDYDYIWFLFCSLPRGRKKINA